MQILSVEINNILSIQHINLDFSKSGLTLLDGWNHDDDSANGAGKTAIPTAISFAIYDKVPRKITKAEIKRRGTKSGFVRAVLQVGDDTIEVKRSRPKGVTYVINNQEVDITQEEFEERIKLSYEQFLVVVYAAQTEGKRFISLNDTEIKDFLMGLMNLNDFAIRKKEIDNKIKELNNVKIEKEKLIVSCSSKRSVYESELGNTNELQAKKDALDPTDLKNTLKKITPTPPDQTQYDEINNKITDKLKNLDNIDADQAMDRARLDSLKKDLKLLNTHSFNESIECPSCNEKLISGADGLQTVEKMQEAHQVKIDNVKRQIEEIVKKINNHTDTVDDRQQILGLRQKISNKIKEQEEQYYSDTARVQDIKHKIEVRQNKINTIDEQLQKQDDYRCKIKEIDDIEVKCSEQLKNTENEIIFNSALSSIMSPTGAPAYLVDSVIDILNDRVADYVSAVWPNAVYRLQTFRQNKTGDVKAKFSHKLVIGGRDVSIGSLSGGELRCLSMSLDFAIIAVVESVFGIKISPIFLDEPFEGLDASNRERVIDLLDKLSVDRSIWIIDHASEAKTMFSHTVRIEKQGGVSGII